MSSLPHTQPDPAGWHFRAGSSLLRVSAAREALGHEGLSPPCAAEAAVALDLIGELLDALQAQGLGAAGAWQWQTQPGLPASGARARWQGRGAQAWLTLPWTALRHLAQPPVLPGLQWLPLPAECLLAQWRFSDEERAALEPGGLVLLDTPCRRPRACSEPGLPGDLPWQLVARWPAPVPLEALMGWAGGLPPLPAEVLLVETAWPDAVLARGRLLPWGSGEALLIEAC